MSSIQFKKARMFNRISTRIPLGFLIILLIAFVMGLTALINFNNSIKMFYKTQKTLILEEYASMLFILKKQAVGAFEAYFESKGKHKFITTYQTSRIRAKVIMGKIDEIIITQRNVHLFKKLAEMDKESLVIENAIIESISRGQYDTSTISSNEELHKLANNYFKLLAIFTLLEHQRTTLMIDDTIKAALDTKKQMIVLMAGLFIFAFALSVFLSRSITRPITQIRNTAKEIARGHFNKKIVVTSKDEIGELAISFNQMIENLNYLMRKEKELAAAAAAVDAEKKRADELQVEITQRKRAEEEKQKMQLKMVVSSKLAGLGEISTGIAHEINQPLTYISSLIQTLKLDIKENSIDETKLEEKLEFATGQVDKIVSIIDHLRVFGRQYDVPMEKIELKTILDNSLMLLGEKIRLKNIKLVCNTEGKLPMVWGNSNQLEQVFINLFQNAIDAFVNKKENAEIRLDIFKLAEREAVQIKFADNGSGMKESIREKIFEPFYTTKKVGEGTGLGLSIVYGIIQEHKGEITCESQINKGTTFTTILPVEKSKSS